MIPALLLAAATMLTPPRQPTPGEILRQIVAAIEAPPDPIEKRVEAARDAAKRRDILGWGLAVMPEKFYVPFCQDLHGYFVQIRHDEMTSTVAPRGYAKTLVKCKLIPMFGALEEPDLFDFYLNIQSTNEKGVNANFSIKYEFETNAVIRALYGDVVGDVKWTDAVFMLKNKVVFRGAGVGDSIRGMNFLDRRPKYTVVDDLYDDDDLDKPDKIAEKNKWFWSSLYPAREKGRAFSFHVQGTVAGENDLMLQLGELAKKDPSIKHREFAAIKPDGTALWPELESADKLKKDRQRMGEALFDRENQGDRSVRKNSIIKKDWLSGWRRPAADFKCDKTDDPYRLIDVVVCVDPSIGKKQNQGNKEGTGDPAGFARIWRLLPLRTPKSLPIFFIDALVMERLSLDDRVQKAKDFVTTARPDRRVRRAKVETIAGFDDIGTLIARAIGVPCEKVPKVDDKMLNLEKHQTFWQNGRVFINQDIDSETLGEIEKQLTTNQPTHDDGRDAVFLGIDDGELRMQDWV